MNIGGIDNVVVAKPVNPAGVKKLSDLYDLALPESDEPTFLRVAVGLADMRAKGKHASQVFPGMSIIKRTVKVCKSFEGMKVVQSNLLAAMRGEPGAERVDALKRLVVGIELSMIADNDTQAAMLMLLYLAEAKNAEVSHYVAEKLFTVVGNQFMSKDYRRDAVKGLVRMLELGLMKREDFQLQINRVYRSIKLHEPSIDKQLLGEYELGLQPRVSKL